MLDSPRVSILYRARSILKVVRGPSKFEWREAEIGISGRPRVLSVTEMRYQHGFTSPTPWWRPTDATRRRWSACSRDRLPVAGGPARRGRSSVGGGRRWRCGRRDGGGAPGWQRDAVSTRSDGRRRRAEALVIATASCGGRACAARRPSISRRDGGERCGYRDGGVLAVAPPAADEHARPVESVEGRREATALRRSRQETLSEARTRSVTARMRKGRLSLSLSLPPLPPPPLPPPGCFSSLSLIGKNPPTPFLLFTFLLSYFLLPWVLFLSSLICKNPPTPNVRTSSAHWTISGHCPP